ncbi:MAG: hypothetical protein D6681_05665 [Calditrichaeota bacterium]|nr:MAG: hypothetical protein D6681_05665 [Calditrichota bacterium]
MVFRLGAGELLVGRTEFCRYPPQARGIPSVGGLLNPDYERMVALQPDVVLLLPNPDMERKLQELGLAPVSLPDETVEDILASLWKLGRLLHREERAEAVIRGIQDTLNWVRQQTAGKPPVRALLVVGREAGSLRGLYAAGKTTYLSQILERCGGKNVFEDVPLRYFDVSKEDLLVRDPEYILEFRILDGEATGEAVSRLKKDWEALPSLRAVRTGKIYLFTERYFLIPGPRIAQIALALYHTLHGGTP